MYKIYDILDPSLYISTSLSVSTRILLSPSGSFYDHWVTEAFSFDLPNTVLPLPVKNDRKSVNLKDTT